MQDYLLQWNWACSSKKEKWDVKVDNLSVQSDEIQLVLMAMIDGVFHHQRSHQCARLASSNVMVDHNTNSFTPKTPPRRLRIGAPLISEPARTFPRPPIRELAGLGAMFPYIPESIGNRRSACDRCRRHKLRCERTGTSRCRRCEKINTNCVTSPAMKSGRPIQLDDPCQQFLQSPEQHTAIDTQHITMDPAMLPLASLETPPEIATHEAGSAVPRLMSPANLDDFNDMWSRGFNQDLECTGIDNLTPYDSSPKHQNAGLNKLADLQTNILTDLELVKSCRTADKCPQAKNPESSITGQNVLIGRVLDHSTTLIDVLNGFRSVGADQASSKLSCDTPTMFALLSCYVCLIRIYRTIFSCILDSMPFLLGIQDPVPQLFPGMHLGGWKLEARLDLQVQILVQISEDMLGKIELALGLSEDSSAPAKDSKTAGILRMMLEEEASEQPPLYERRGECGTLREIMASVKDAGRGS